MMCTETSTAIGNIEGDCGGFLVDENYEFLAPKFFDFINEETREDARRAEVWFENGNAYDPSPFSININGSRFDQAVDNIIGCDLENLGTNEDINMHGQHGHTNKVKNMVVNVALPEAEESDDEMDLENDPVQPKLKQRHLSNYSVLAFKRVPGILGNEVSNPKPPPSRNRTDKEGIAHHSSSGNQILKQKNTTKQCSSSMQRKHLTPYTSSKSTIPKNAAATLAISQENQAIKKQKIDGGGIRPTHNVNTRVLHHKSKADMAPLSTEKNHKKDGIATKRNRPKLTLTRPVEPDFETKNRVRAVKIKSSAEIEEEMLAKIPKFKARPVNKKILEVPELPAAPHAPQFKEFHLKMMESGNRHDPRSSSSSSPSISPMDPSCEDHHPKILKLTQPKQPFLFTSLRAREVKLKSSEELELEELAKVPKFQAKPLNKKMFKSKGDVNSLFNNPKHQTTIPREFHFATNERLGPTTNITTSMVVEESFKQYDSFSSQYTRNVGRNILYLGLLCLILLIFIRRKEDWRKKGEFRSK